MASDQREVTTSRPSPVPATMAAPRDYRLRISRLTIDKLGVKLYDKASAVVAELIANGYDADAENVTVRIPLNVALAVTRDGQIQDRGFIIEVEDDGHGMTPDEAIDFYLRVGTDRRARQQHGSRSRSKHRPVLGRKGIGKLAPFGICRRIEVRSAGGQETEKGFAITHFFMDFDKIVNDQDEDVPLEAGADDRTWSARAGTRIRLMNFLAKRVPDEVTFLRQLAVRFTLAQPDFRIFVVDTERPEALTLQVDPLNIPLSPGTEINLADRPVLTDDGHSLPVSGWLAMAKDPYKFEETSGVRIYARGKIVAITRDFNQPAGFTGEFAMRSYLVGKVEADWLDLDDGEDLIRTDRQDILWDSEYGVYLRKWGAELIKEIARRTYEPRRLRVRDTFLQRSQIEAKAKARYGDKDVANVAINLGKRFGSFADEDELANDEYIDGLTDFILSVAPHQALMEAFHEFSKRVTSGPASIEQLLDIFDKTQIAELASYAQIAAERVRVINELKQIIHDAPDESAFQALLAKAPWLIEPSWTVITQNQSLRTFKDQFERFWRVKHGEEITLAISYEQKRPDFTLISIDGFLHIVEIKKANHALDDNDLERTLNYVEAFREFFIENRGISQNFSRGWRIDIVSDGEDIRKVPNRLAFQQVKEAGEVCRHSWSDFLDRAVKVHEQFLEVHDAIARALPKVGSSEILPRGGVARG